MDQIAIVTVSLATLIFHLFAKLVIILGNINYYYKYTLSSTAIGDWNSCSLAADAAKCTKCDSLKKRIFVGSTEGNCKCDFGWFDDGM